MTRKNPSLEELSAKIKKSESDAKKFKEMYRAQKEKQLSAKTKTLLMLIKGVFESCVGRKPKDTEEAIDWAMEELKKIKIEMENQVPKQQYIPSPAPQPQQPQQQTQAQSMQDILFATTPVPPNCNDGDLPFC